MNFKYAASSIFIKTLDLSEIKLICTGLMLLEVFFPKQFLDNSFQLWSRNFCGYQ